MMQTIPRAGRRGGGNPAVKDGNGDDDEEDMIEVMGVLTPP